MPNPNIEKMKKLTLTVITAFFILSIYFVLFLIDKGQNEIIVSTTEAEEEYTFKASFDASLMPKVERYMDSCASILRKEEASFRIKTSAGKLAVTADKPLNSEVAMDQIRTMCQGINKVLIQD
jgi:uncharacterized protein YpmS